MGRAFRWTKFRMLLRETLTHPSEPMTPDELKAWLCGLRRKAAKEQGWLQSELICSIADDQREVDEVVAQLKKGGAL